MPGKAAIQPNNAASAAGDYVERVQVVDAAGNIAGSGAAQTSAGYVRPRKLVTYRALYRLASRPYALSSAFGAAGRTQFATIFHAAGATKLVKLRHVWVALESASAAAIAMADLAHLTAAATPATGNPAITPRALAPGDAAAEATALALPTTPGTEDTILGTQEWNLGITGAASTNNPPPGLNWYDLLALNGFSPDEEDKLPEMRAATAEGYAVTIDASAAATVKGYVLIEFTEE